MIRHLIFDFGNVLLESDFELFISRITNDERVKDLFRQHVFTRQFTHKLDLGYQSSSQLFAQLAQQYPLLAPTLVQFEGRWMEHLVGEMPGMYALLQRYKQQGFKLYGLSNWSDLIYPVLAKYPIFGLLDGRIISYEEHLVKPDPAIYQVLLDRFSLTPQECLFTDDKPENVVTAQQLGMQGIVFRNAAQFEVELNSIITSIE